MPRATAKKWKREILHIAVSEFNIPNVTIELSRSNHIKVYSDRKLICTCSSSPGDPAILYAYRRQFRAFKRGNEQ
jgi:hypothetical protein